MKHKLFFLFLLALFLGCRGDNDSFPLPIFELEGSGVLAEQTVEEAEKTIYGKWGVHASGAQKGNSSTVQRVHSPAKTSHVNCSFHGIEFTRQRYILGVQHIGSQDGNVSDELVYSYGTYRLIEAADGRVSRVDLFTTVSGVEQRLASLTDFTVEKNNSGLRASFSIAFETNVFSTLNCSELSGSYTALKAEPMDDVALATASSNFDLLINTWELQGYSNEAGEGLTQMLYRSSCVVPETDELVADCDPATAAEVSFSAYGTYVFSFLNASGDVLQTLTDSWEFQDDSQTTITLEEDTIIQIEALTSVLLRLQSSTEDDTETWDFLRLGE
ncbi:MAG: hypothetical protein ACON42_01305 [Flavobacteriaceae bacterium]